MTKKMQSSLNIILFQIRRLKLDQVLDIPVLEIAMQYLSTHPGQRAYFCIFEKHSELRSEVQDKIRSRSDCPDDCQGCPSLCHRLIVTTTNSDLDLNDVGLVIIDEYECLYRNQDRKFLQSTCKSDAHVVVATSINAITCEKLNLTE